MKMTWKERISLGINIAIGILIAKLIIVLLVLSVASIACIFQ